LASPNEPYGLRYTGNKGAKILPKGDQKLMADVGMIKAVLVIMVWEEGVTQVAKSGKSLRSEIAEHGRQIEIHKPEEVENDDVGSTVKLIDKEEQREAKPKGKPKWFKMGKK